MSGVTSCKQCGCSEIDTDPARGDAVCTNCGYVLEESIIVSEVTFEEDGHGGASAVGQFVSAESRGGGGIAVGPNGFHQGGVKESRELTLRAAKKKIQEVAQVLRLNQHCVDVAFNFFKMALHKQLTKGRKNALTIAACVYMTCRIEGTPHLLIDFSDVVQMDVYALGRAYIQISRSLFINIPAVDPCMYILRFAHKFDLGDKTHEVAMTALRLVQRMKRDWIHLGRRPSGLCGAALLIAARLHNFSRTVQDIIKIVKVHETTLRKRLVEFGETPSSSLTLDEFMSVDLEEEHDPPSFKAARIKDREQLQKLLDDEVSGEFIDLQKRIDEELDKRQAKALERERMFAAKESESASREAEDTTRFIMESTISTINDLIDDPVNAKDGLKVNECNSEPLKEEKEKIAETPKEEKVDCKELLGPLKPDSDTALSICDVDRILMPPPTLTTRVNDAKNEDDSTDEDEPPASTEPVEEDDLTEGIDDDEINAYIMNPYEVKSKTILWEQINADYIQQQELKKSQNKLSRKEVKAERQKQKKKNNQKKALDVSSTYQAKTASEAIKIMLMERKMSNKINYDVLKTLSSISNDLFGHAGGSSASSSTNVLTPKTEDEDSKPIVTVIESGPVVPKRNMKRNQTLEGDEPTHSSTKKSRSKRSKNEAVEVSVKPEPDEVSKDRQVKIEESGSSSEKSSDGIKKAEEFVIESGPIRYADNDRESDEEDEQFSASQLLTKFRGEEDDYDDYYD
ncbi:unnamed protein product [Allacma fusca]|uniref:B-related factor 1 n=1 Tax=Allacma fusca TaxID=39272 RepID=A0A8J2KJ16_9HEXA|nr:unnamed protein product [Allacma fusca]